MLQRIVFAQEHHFKKVIINIYFRNTPALKTVANFGFKNTYRLPLVYRRGTLTNTFNNLHGKN
jgi:hypothetical protein